MYQTAVGRHGIELAPLVVHFDLLISRKYGRLECVSTMKMGDIHRKFSAFHPSNRFRQNLESKKNNCFLLKNFLF